VLPFESGFFWIYPYVHVDLGHVTDHIYFILRLVNEGDVS